MTAIRKTPFGPNHRKLAFAIPEEMVESVMARAKEMGMPIWMYVVYCISQDLSKKAMDGGERKT